MLPLVLLGGMGCSDRLWAGVVDRLPSDRRVLQLDPPGDRLDDVVAALLAAAPSRFALAGLSLGGILAMAVTRTAPERVERLALASTNPRPPTPAQRAAWSDHGARLEQGVAPGELQRELLPVLVRPAALADLAHDVVAMAEDLGRERLADQLRLQATRVDERPGLTRVAVPTLVLAAQDDVLCPLERHEEIHALVPGSRLVLLRDTGHLSPMERPAEVADALGAWLVAGARG